MIEINCIYRVSTENTTATTADKVQKEFYKCCFLFQSCINASFMEVMRDQATIKLSQMKCEKLTTSYCNHHSKCGASSR